MQRETESMRVTAEAQIGVPHLHIRECQEQPPIPRSTQRALDSFPPSEPLKGASHANTLTFVFWPPELRKNTFLLF